MIPSNKIERTISLQLIHTYSVDDPAGLRRPELGATGEERMDEQHFGVDEIGSNERERERRQPFGEKQSKVGSQGVLPPPLFIGGGGGEPTWRGGQP